MGGTIFHSVLANTQITVAVSKRVEADTPDRHRGPFETPPRPAADIQHTLARKIFPGQLELVSEKLLTVFQPTAGIILRLSPEIELSVTLWLELTEDTPAKSCPGPAAAETPDETSRRSVLVKLFREIGTPWRQDQAAISPARVWIYALVCTLEFITMSRVPGTGTPIYTAIHQRSGHAAQRERGEVVPEKALVSFVVIAYNEAHSVAQTLAAITQLEDLGQYEVIVVDAALLDTTAKIVTGIAAYDTHVRLVSLEANRGRGHARHRGIAAARGELIAMVDADITLPAHWLVRTRAALLNHDAAGGTAVPDGDVAYIYRRFALLPRVVPGTTAITGNNGLVSPGSIRYC